MTVAFYFDEGVNAAIVSGLRQQSVDVLTVQEDGRRGASDEVVLQRAAELGRVLVTSDADHLAIAGNLPAHRGALPCRIVFLAQGRLRVGRAVFDLHRIATITKMAEITEWVTYLPLRVAQT